MNGGIKLHILLQGDVLRAGEWTPYLNEVLINRNLKAEAVPCWFNCVFSFGAVYVFIYLFFSQRDALILGE